MRKVYIQIFCIYLFLFYMMVVLYAHNYPMSKFMLVSSFLSLIVFIKIMFFKRTTNMFYNSLFLFLSLIVNYILIDNFIKLHKDSATVIYLFQTIPLMLKELFVVANLGITLLCIYEFFNTYSSN